MDNKKFEIGKMDVDSKFQGLGIGQKRLSFAKAKAWDGLVLYPNTDLNAALHIYRKHGFKKVDLEERAIYLRSDNNMELHLQQNRNIVYQSIASNQSIYKKKLV